MRILALSALVAITLSAGGCGKSQRTYSQEEVSAIAAKAAKDALANQTQVASAAAPVPQEAIPPAP